MKYFKHILILSLFFNGAFFHAFSQDKFINFETNNFSLSYYDYASCFGQDISISIPFFYFEESSTSLSTKLNEMNNIIKEIGDETMSWIESFNNDSILINGYDLYDCNNIRESLTVDFKVFKNDTNCLSFEVSTNWLAGNGGSGRGTKVQYFTFDTISGIITTDSLFTENGKIEYYKLINKEYNAEYHDSICINTLCTIDSCNSYLPCGFLNYIGYHIKDNLLIASTNYDNRWFHEYEFNFEDIKTFIKPKYYKLFK